MLDDARARLTTLDAQIMLTRRTIKAQEYNAQSVAAAVERAKALVKQTTSSRTRLEPLVPQGFASQEDLDRARTAEKPPARNSTPLCCKRNRLRPPLPALMPWLPSGRGYWRRSRWRNCTEFTEVRAPFNGVVVALKTTVGQYASALKPVFTLMDDDRWYVIANFRETDLKMSAPA